MRLTSLLRSAHGFGELAKVHNIVIYKLSPFEQRAFANFMSHCVPNVFTRVRASIFIVTPPFIMAYLVFSYNEARHHHLGRKNPADYVNEE